MARLPSVLLLLLWAASATVVLSIVPNEAQAHVSVYDSPYEVVSEADDPKGHCHGEIECVVTLFPADIEEDAVGLYPNPEHFAAQDLTLKTSETARDPPVPIL